MTDEKIILLAEDNPADVELTLRALEQNKVANKVVAVKNGEEALDYLCLRGDHWQRQAEGDKAPHCHVEELREYQGDYRTDQRSDLCRLI